MEDLRYFWDTEAELESPINILTRLVRPLMVPKLLWFNVKVKPYKTKVTNNGYSVFVTPKWGRTMPFISDGPLGEKRFLFYNIHFHWADTDNRGSEHKLNGEFYPFEMHVLWRNEAYKTARKAKREVDGIVIVAYLFEISPNVVNHGLEPIVDCLEPVRKGGTSTYLKESLSVSELMLQCEEDYFMYRGCIKNFKWNHQITWVVCKQMQQIGIKQITAFRRLWKQNGYPISNNSRHTSEMSNDRVVYEVRPPALTFALAMQYRNSNRLAVFCTIYQRSPFMVNAREACTSEDHSKDNVSESFPEISNFLINASIYNTAVEMVQ